MRPYVKHVATNLKLGADVDLGKHTLIIGPNWSGKSTIVNAVELAGSGRASDIAGRATLADGSELSTLIPSGASQGRATAELSDSSSASWTLNRGKRANREGTLVAFPLREVRDALLGSPETARKWLLSQVAEGYPWGNVLARLAPQWHERASVLAGRTALGLPTALEAVRKQARDETRRAETLRESARRAAAGIGAPYTVEEVAALRARAADTLKDQLEEQWERVEELEAQLDGVRGRVTTLSARLSGLPVVDSRAAEVGQAIQRVLRAQIDTGSNTCGICTAGFATAEAEERLAAVEEIIAASVKSVTEREKAAAAYTAAMAEETGLARDLAEVKRTAETLEAAIDAMPMPPEVAQRQAAWDSVQSTEAQAVEADRTASDARALADALASITGQLVEEARMGFEARVRQSMPMGLAFGLDLTDGDREVARFGLRDAGGSLRTALSGAEWAIVTAALAAATTPADGPAVIAPEERAFDAQTLSLALRASYAIDAQVIMTSPIEPAEVPEGWTVIRVGAAAATAKPIVYNPSPEALAALRETAAEIEKGLDEHVEPEKPKRTRKPKAAETPPAEAPSTKIDVATLFK